MCQCQRRVKNIFLKFVVYSVPPNSELNKLPDRGRTISFATCYYPLCVYEEILAVKE